VLSVLGVIIFLVYTLYITDKHVCADFSLDAGRTTPKTCWLKNKENTASIYYSATLTLPGMPQSCASSGQY